MATSERKGTIFELAGMNIMQTVLKDLRDDYVNSKVKEFREELESQVTELLEDYSVSEIIQRSDMLEMKEEFIVWIKTKEGKEQAHIKRTLRGQTPEGSREHHRRKP